MKPVSKFLAERKYLRRVIAACVVASAAAGIWAGDARAIDKPLDTSQYITLQFDNDMFGGTDRHFTNGMRAAWLSEEGGAPRIIRDAASFVPFFKATRRMRMISRRNTAATWVGFLM